MHTLLSMSCCSCRGWRNHAVDQGMQGMEMEEVQAVHWDADDGQARSAGWQAEQELQQGMAARRSRSGSSGGGGAMSGGGGAMSGGGALEVRGQL
jgi:uncharacterized membrane protein YgcG